MNVKQWNDYWRRNMERMGYAKTSTASPTARPDSGSEEDRPAGKLGKKAKAPCAASR